MRNSVLLSSSRILNVGSFKKPLPPLVICKVGFPEVLKTKLASASSPVPTTNTRIDLFKSDAVLLSS